MFLKKSYEENQYIGLRFLIVDLPAKPAKNTKRVAIENSLRLHTRETPAAAAESV